MIPTTEIRARQIRRMPVCICTGMWVEVEPGCFYRGDLHLVGDCLVAIYNPHSCDFNPPPESDKILSAVYIGLCRKTDGHTILVVPLSLEGAFISQGLLDYCHNDLYRETRS